MADGEVDVRSPPQVEFEPRTPGSQHETGRHRLQEENRRLVEVVAGLRSDVAKAAAVAAAAWRAEVADLKRQNAELEDELEAAGSAADAAQMVADDARRAADAMRRTVAELEDELAALGSAADAAHAAADAASAAASAAAAATTDAATTTDASAAAAPTAAVDERLAEAEAEIDRLSAALMSAYDLDTMVRRIVLDESPVEAAHDASAPTDVLVRGLVYELEARAALLDHYRAKDAVLSASPAHGQTPVAPPSPFAPLFAPHRSLADVARDGAAVFAVAVLLAALLAALLVATAAAHPPPPRRIAFTPT